MIVNANLIVQHTILIKNEKNDKCQYECKKYWTCKRDYSWNPSTCICENSKYLKGISDTSVIAHGEIINATGNVKLNGAITIPTNMTSIAF